MHTIEQPCNFVKLNITLSVKQVVLLTQFFINNLLYNQVTLFILSRIQYSTILVRSTYIPVLPTIPNT